MSSSGRVLAEDHTGTDLVDALTTVLPQYGQLQRDLARHTDDLLALGVTDMRASIMPRRFDEALDAVHGYAKSAPRPTGRPTNGWRLCAGRSPRGASSSPSRGG